MTIETTTDAAVIFPTCILFRAIVRKTSIRSMADSSSDSSDDPAERRCSAVTFSVEFSTINPFESSVSDYSRRLSQYIPLEFAGILDHGGDAGGNFTATPRYIVTQE